MRHSDGAVRSFDLCRLRGRCSFGDERQHLFPGQTGAQPCLQPDGQRCGPYLHALHDIRVQGRSKGGEQLQLSGSGRVQRCDPQCGRSAGAAGQPDGQFQGRGFAGEVLCRLSESDFRRAGIDGKESRTECLGRPPGIRGASAGEQPTDLRKRFAGRPYRYPAGRASVPHRSAGAAQDIGHGGFDGGRCHYRRHCAGRSGNLAGEDPLRIAMDLREPDPAGGQMGGPAGPEGALRADDFVRLRAGFLFARRGQSHPGTSREEPDDPQDRRCEQHRLAASAGCVRWWRAFGSMLPGKRGKHRSLPPGSLPRPIGRARSWLRISPITYRR